MFGKLNKNKNGIFFTFAAIVLSIIIILSFNTYNIYRMKDEIELVEIRINTMNRFVKDMQEDMENAVFIAGFRAILSLEDYMMKHDKFMGQDDSPNLATGFKSLFLNGTIITGVATETMGLMKNNSFRNWTKRMEMQADKTGILLGFTINDVTISHSEPWMVDVSVDLRIKVNDTKGTASWEINRVFKKKINISAFVDPLYLVNNNGLVNNTMTVTTVNPSASSSDLNTHLINSYYIEHSDAPSYLMRFENNLGSSTHGIESLVNSQERINAGLSALDRSAVDYIYFGTQVTTNCKINNPSYSWFKLDTPNHKDFYNAQCGGGGDD